MRTKYLQIRRTYLHIPEQFSPVSLLPLRVGPSKIEAFKVVVKVINVIILIIVDVVTFIIGEHRHQVGIIPQNVLVCL